MMNQAPKRIASRIARTHDGVDSIALTGKLPGTRLMLGIREMMKDDRIGERNQDDSDDTSNRQEGVRRLTTMRNTLEWKAFTLDWVLKSVKETAEEEDPGRLVACRRDAVLVGVSCG
jgi:hypothetical protein